MTTCQVFFLSFSAWWDLVEHSLLGIFRYHQAGGTQSMCPGMWACIFRWRDFGPHVCAWLPPARQNTAAAAERQRSSVTGMEIIQLWPSSGTPFTWDHFSRCRVRMSFCRDQQEFGFSLKRVGYCTTRGLRGSTASCLLSVTTSVMKLLSSLYVTCCGSVAN